MRRRVLVVLLLAPLLLSGCGAAEGKRAQPAERLEAAPPIKVIDEPASDEPLPAEGRVRDGAIVICAGGRNPAKCEPTPEQIAEGERKQREFRAAVAPAEDSKPRAIASLGLAAREHEATATLIAWRARSDKLCLRLETRQGDVSGGSGPWGPCIPDRPCLDLCLQRAGEGDGRKLQYVLAGVLAARGDELRIVFPDDHAVRYPLAGPIVPGFPQYRVFLLDLGANLYRRLELLRDGDVLEAEVVPLVEIETARCFRRFPARMPDDVRATTYEDPNPELTACLHDASQEHDNG